MIVSWHRLLGAAALAAAIFVSASGAWAQGSLLQGGPFVIRHLPIYATGSGQAVLMDGGPASGGQLGQGISELMSIVPPLTTAAPWGSSGTGFYGTNDCRYDAPINNLTGGHYLCSSPNAQGGALIAAGTFGGAIPQGLKFIVDGVTIPLTGGDPASGAANVKSFGAVGDSDGETHGSGTDDTAAFQAAFNAAAQVTGGNSGGGKVYVPCGNYRLTGQVFGPGSSVQMQISGAGPCAKIWLDNTAELPTGVFNFNGLTSCTLRNCLIIENLYFLPPRIKTNTVAVYDKNYDQPLFQYTYFNGYTSGVQLVSAVSPTFWQNIFENNLGAAIDCSLDGSCNNAKIWNNNFSFNGNTYSKGIIEAGEAAAPSPPCNTSSISFIGNDVEANYAGPRFWGVCGITIQDNYIESNTEWAFAFGSQSWAAHLQGNSIALNGPSNSFAVANVTGLDFGSNFWQSQTLTLGSGVAALNWAYQFEIAPVSLSQYCSEVTSCFYTQSGVLNQTGSGTTAGGSPPYTFSVTFPIVCGATPLSEQATPISGSGAKVWITPVDTGHMTVNSDTNSQVVSWSLLCRSS